METISIINLKGGVAKTVSAINIAHILAVHHRRRVLLVDNDKQGNTTKFFCGGECDIAGYTIAELLTGKGASAADVLISTQYEKLQLIGADMSLVTANRQLMLDSTRPQQTRLKKALEPVSGDYDYCIIDNAPDIALNTINALVASDYVIIPAKLDKFVLEGLEILIDSIAEVKEHFNSGLRLLGAFVTMKYNERRRDNAAFYSKALEDIQRITGVEPFGTAIPRTGKIDESTYSGKPILEYSRGSTASFGYLKLTAEMLGRMDF